MGSESSGNRTPVPIGDAILIASVLMTCAMMLIAFVLRFNMETICR